MPCKPSSAPASKPRFRRKRFTKSPSPATRRWSTCCAASTAHNWGRCLCPHARLAAAGRSLGCRSTPRLAYAFSCDRGFVGGDTVAGMLVTRIDQIAGPVLLMDIGTNGELVLAHQGKLLGGFHGGRAGVRGRENILQDAPRAKAIGRSSSTAMCALLAIGNAQPVRTLRQRTIDAAAELLRHGIAPRAATDELPALAEPLRKRVFCDGEHVEFRLHEDAKSDRRRPRR